MDVNTGWKLKKGAWTCIPMPPDSVVMKVERLAKEKNAMLDDESGIGTRKSLVMQKIMMTKNL